MKDRFHHVEWLNLIDVSGPFLAEPVLNEAFPQGFEGLDAEKRRLVRQAYDEWREALDLDDPEFPKIHRAWIDHVLRLVLELDENGTGDILKSGAKVPETLRYDIPGRSISLSPDYAVLENRANGRALLLIVSYGEKTSLTEALGDSGYVASPADRTIELCRGTGVRLGLVTNGEQWMLVDAPVGAVVSFASWYARHWSQEPVTLQAFVNLLGVRRFFVDHSQQLPALLDDSLKYQDEVTDALGEQVARAVEVLVQALDRADIDRDRELLHGIEPAELYEAGLTVMMRIVFLLSAEERGLLLLGDERYETGYAVSTLRMQLREESEEILERRWDAWSRLLSIFRAVFAGVDHEEMRLPALGGSLFDPNRFPFLEGRKRGSHWKNDLATPLPIDNRTVLYLLDAVQIFQGRTLSYLALDIEQIGYVYEGLLERTVVRTREVTLDLDATKNAKNPWVSLPELDDAAASGRPALEALLKERTGSSAARVRNDVNRPVDDACAERLLTACHADENLRNRIRPYFHLLRTDRWGYPIVYPKGAFTVATGTDRRETGTHYTPKSFTEAIVRETLEQLVYHGPAQGLPRESWKLKSPATLLDLKVCDPAMGSGAFLVQACRWLADRLAEAWSSAEANGAFVAADGEVVAAIGSREPMRKDAEERVLTARRLIAERCLYGVDMNPLAVELAKLSIWLITLAKGRPFGFLDHNFRSGDSLLGIARLEQLNYLEINPSKGSTRKLFAAHVDQAVAKAIELRTNLRNCPIRDIRDVEAMARLDEEARRKLVLPELIADALISEVLAANGRTVDTTPLSIRVGSALAGHMAEIEPLKDSALTLLTGDLSAENNCWQPFHWPLEFPEVFSRTPAGFDAFVGNPPFLGGQRISGNFGASYKEYLAHHLSLDQAATADLVVFFFLRVFSLVRDGGHMGLLARRNLAEGKNREIGLEQLIKSGLTIHSVYTNIPWPGKAAIVVHQIHMTKGAWRGLIKRNNVPVTRISAYLEERDFGSPKEIEENTGRMFQGIIPNNEELKVNERDARLLLSADDKYRDVVFPFIGGHEVNSDPSYRPGCWVINFWDWPETKAKRYGLAFETIERQIVRQTGKKKAPGKWWRFLRPRPDLFHAIGRGRLFDKHPKGWNSNQRALERVLVISRRVTKYPAFTFLPNTAMFSENLYVLADERYSLLCILSSDIHALWAWAQKTSMANNLSSLSYTNGDVFETFPFPTGLLENGDTELENLGLRFFDARHTYMTLSGKGLTKFYNDFHDPTVTVDMITALRRLQQDTNFAVCRRYGWGDLDVSCEFHEVGYLPQRANVRFTVSEAVRRDVLLRLSKLNQERVEQQSEISTANARGSFPEDVAINGDLFAQTGIDA